MPIIKTKQLEELIARKRYGRVVVRSIGRVYYLIVYDEQDQPLIHCNNDGRHKVYRCVEQPLEWLKRKFGLINVEVDDSKHVWGGSEDESS